MNFFRQKKIILEKYTPINIYIYIYIYIYIRKVYMMIQSNKILEGVNAQK